MTGQYFEDWNEARPFSWCDVRYSAEERERIGRPYAARFAYKWNSAVMHSGDVKQIVLNDCWSPIIFSSDYRHGTNFVESHWCALDFERPDYTLEDAFNDFCDTICLIGTSLHHMIPHEVPEHGLVTWPRFRVLIPWERPITLAAEYKHNMEHVIKKYGADPSCADAARFFYPCKTFKLGISDGYLQPVIPRKPSTLNINPGVTEEKRREFNLGRKPAWITNFLERGELPMSGGECSKSRAVTVAMVTRKLIERGFEAEEIWGWLQKSPFDRIAFGDWELRLEFEKGLKRAYKDLKK